ncbi:glucose-1-phosphate adenylyltransferase subunit GlgD [Acetanaerobacterium elongatum]|uniref:Glucose-1-phosphate adenylyltransferase n=1 Tax=Acetanaerobacterium elongatum TaxID=258515 RepID=A0A1G9ZVH5_9FIRM|nr:glucose-1-phosphate adenylyltransferase subunit GlgD [Acetanaerobacterium elongatum]SDN25087.1 glucose-1-phosphate adenylyltransferase [Acetanaerobacterium elongatum]
MQDRKKILGIIFSNMHDEMLRELTEKRTMASVPFGGRYRFIDFTLSSLVNSNIQSVGVITKSNYQSLMDHLGSGREWDLARKREGLYILPPFGNAGVSGIYRGRIEALAGIMGFIKHSDARYVVLADCDTICNYNIKTILNEHIEKEAEITAVYQRKELNAQNCRDATVFSCNESGRITDVMINPGIQGECNVSLNLMIMEKALLERLVTENMSRNLFSMEKDVLQAKASAMRLYGYEYKGFCAKIDSMRDYFDANMMMLNKEVRDELFINNGPIYTKVRDDMPAKYGLNSKVTNSLIADGCMIEGEVENSVLFRGVTVGKGAKISNSIIMQDTSIGEKSVLNYCITDKDVTIKDNRMLMGYLSYPVFISKASVV